MLAKAGGQMGLGWAFGINEGLDQLGALIGPLAVAALLAWRHSYSLAFAALAIPAIVTLLVVGSARLSFSYAGHVEHNPETSAVPRYLHAFWWYCLGTGLVGFGFADYSLIAAVARMVPHERLGSAYGVFGLVFGAAWFVGSAALGALYDRSVPAAVMLAVVSQLCAVVPIAIAARMLR